MKIFEFLTALLAWVEIAVSPLLIGSVIGVLVYAKFPSEKGIVLGLFIAALGLIIGIVWATRICKKQGTVEFMSKVSSNSEFYEPEEEKE
jgi:hypothetical protein